MKENYKACAHALQAFMFCLPTRVMGVKISSLVTKEKITLESLANKTLAVDALNTLYQFLSIIRQYDGTPLKDTHGNITSHLSGLFYRSINQMSAGVHLVYVFDGKAPDLKTTTTNKRRAVRKEAREKWQEALEKGDLIEAKKHAQASVEMTEDILAESKELLAALGIPVVQAPSEGEAQASYMAKKGDVYAVASSDLDSILFGAPRLIRNLNITGKRKIPGTGAYRDVVPEVLSCNKILKELGITHEQLINLGILIGTDYNPGGIKGIGPKTALKLVRKHPKFDDLMANVKWESETSPEKIRDFFLSPPVTNGYSLEQGVPDIEKVKKILCGRHEFSGERVDNTFKKLLELDEKKKQTTLGKWG